MDKQDHLLELLHDKPGKDLSAAKKGGAAEEDEDDDSDKEERIPLFKDVKKRFFLDYLDQTEQVKEESKRSAGSGRSSRKRFKSGIKQFKEDWHKQVQECYDALKKE